ncbi:MAG: HpcH/HpaI aldolase family protein [Hyphomicrobiales bacterium]
MSSAKTLKERLHAGENLTGCFVMLPSPTVVEMLGYAGFDFVILDQEHGPAGSETLENQIRAADCSGLETIVRVSAGTFGNIQRALDSGAGGIIVPHVIDKAHAERIVAASHYPPLGRRGIATTARAGRHGMVPVGDHLEKASRRTLVMPQIEDREALANVEAIGATPGIDALFIGPADLSMSLGHPGNAAHPDVVEAIAGICSDLRKTPAKLAIFVRTAADARKFRAESGIQMACFSSTAIFSTALTGLMQELAE